MRGRSRLPGLRDEIPADPQLLPATPDGRRGGRQAGNRAPASPAFSLPDGIVRQQYAPDALVGRDYYRPTGRGVEAQIGARLAKLRAILRRGR